MLSCVIIFQICGSMIYNDDIFLVNIRYNDVTQVLAIHHLYFRIMDDQTFH
jgi:hypothetical protein